MKDTLQAKIVELAGMACNYDCGPKHVQIVTGIANAAIDQIAAKDAEIAALRADGERLIHEAEQAKGEVVAAEIRLAEAEKRAAALEAALRNSSEANRIVHHDSALHGCLTEATIERCLHAHREAQAALSGGTSALEAIRKADQERIAALEAALTRFVAEARHHYATGASSLAALVEMGESALRGSK